MDRLSANVQQGRKRPHEDSQVLGSSQSHLSQGNVFGGPAMIGSLTRSLSPEREIALKKAKTELSNYEVDVEIFVIDGLTRSYALNAEKRLATMGLNVKTINVDETIVKLALDKAKNNLVKFIIIVSKKHEDLKTADLHVLKTRGQFKFPDLSLDSILTYFYITYQTSLEPKVKTCWVWREAVEAPLMQYNPPEGNKTQIHPKLITPINDLGVSNMELGQREKEPEHTNWHQLGPSPSLFQKEHQKIDKDEVYTPKMQQNSSKGDQMVEIETTITVEEAKRGQTTILELLKAQNCSFGIMVEKWSIKTLKKSKNSAGTTLSLLIPDSDAKIIQEKFNGKLGIGKKQYFFKTICGLGIGNMELGKRKMEPEQTNMHELRPNSPLFQKQPQQSDKEKLSASKVKIINSKCDQMVEMETIIQEETAMRGETKILEFLKAQNCSFGLKIENWKIKTFEKSKASNGTTLSLLIPDSDVKIIQEKLNGNLSIGIKHYFFKTIYGLGAVNLELGNREKESEQTNLRQLEPSSSLFPKEPQKSKKEELETPKTQPFSSKGDQMVEIETKIQIETAMRGQTKILELLKAQNCSFGLMVEKWKIKCFEESKISNVTTLSLLIPDSDAKIIQEKLKGKLSIGTKHYIFKTIIVDCNMVLGKREKEPEQTNLHQLVPSSPLFQKEPQKSNKEELETPKTQPISSEGDQMVQIETKIQIETAMRGQTKILELLKAQNCSFGLMIENWKIKTFEKSKISNATTLSLLIPDSDAEIIQEKLNGKLSIGTKHYIFKTVFGVCNMELGKREKEPEQTNLHQLVPSSPLYQKEPQKSDKKELNGPKLQPLSLNGIREKGPEQTNMQQLQPCSPLFQKSDKEELYAPEMQPISSKGDQMVEIETTLTFEEAKRGQTRILKLLKIQNGAFGLMVEKWKIKSFEESRISNVTTLCLLIPDSDVKIIQEELNGKLSIGKKQYIFKTIFDVCDMELDKRENEPEQTNLHQLGPSLPLFLNEPQKSNKKELNDPKIQPLSLNGIRENEPEQTNMQQSEPSSPLIQKEHQKSDKDDVYNPKMQQNSSKGDQMVEIETTITLEEAKRGQTRILKLLKIQNGAFGLMVEKWKIKTFEESKTSNVTTLCLLIPDSDVKIIQEKLNGRLSIARKRYIFKTIFEVCDMELGKIEKGPEQTNLHQLGPSPPLFQNEPLKSDIKELNDPKIQPLSLSGIREKGPEQAYMQQLEPSSPIFLKEPQKSDEKELNAPKLLPISSKGGQMVEIETKIQIETLGQNAKLAKMAKMRGQNKILELLKAQNCSFGLMVEKWKIKCFEESKSSNVITLSLLIPDCDVKIIQEELNGNLSIGTNHYMFKTIYDVGACNMEVGKREKEPECTNMQQLEPSSPLFQKEPEKSDKEELYAPEMQPISSKGDQMVEIETTITVEDAKRGQTRILKLLKIQNGSFGLMVEKWKIKTLKKSKTSTGTMLSLLIPDSDVKIIQEKLNGKLSIGKKRYCFI